MNDYFSFLFDTDSFNYFIKPQCIELYDIQYIDKIQAKIQRNFSSMKSILSKISIKATGKKNDLIKNFEKELE